MISVHVISFFNIGTNVSVSVGSDKLFLSRGQRKRLKRRMSQIKKLDLVNEHLVKKSSLVEAKQALDISSLKSSILEMKKPSSFTSKNRVLTSRSRKHVNVSELGQFKAVHQHLLLQKNAFDAIQEHLRNTIVAK